MLTSDPRRYAFSAAMDNEFKRIDLFCDGSYITPYGGNYPTTLGANQVCTLPGSQPGNPYVPGRDYLQAAFEYDIAHQWRNWVSRFRRMTVESCAAADYVSPLSHRVSPSSSSSLSTSSRLSSPRSSTTVPVLRPSTSLPRRTRSARRSTRSCRRTRSVTARAKSSRTCPT